MLICYCVFKNMILCQKRNMLLCYCVFKKKLLCQKYVIMSLKSYSV